MLKDEMNRAANTKATNKPKTVAKIKGVSDAVTSIGELSVMTRAKAISMAINKAINEAGKGPGILNEADFFLRPLAFLFFLLLVCPFPELGRILVTVAQLEHCSS